MPEWEKVENSWQMAICALHERLFLFHLKKSSIFVGGYALGSARFSAAVFLRLGLRNFPCTAIVVDRAEERNPLFSPLYQKKAKKKKKKAASFPFFLGSCQIWMPAPVCSVKHWVRRLSDVSWQHPFGVIAKRTPKSLSLPTSEKNRITEICIWLSVQASSEMWGIPLPTTAIKRVVIFMLVERLAFSL